MPGDRSGWKRSARSGRQPGLGALGAPAGGGVRARGHTRSPSYEAHQRPRRLTRPYVGVVGRGAVSWG